MFKSISTFCHSLKHEIRQDSTVEKEANRAKEVFVMSDFVPKVHDPPLLSTVATAMTARTV